MDIEVTREALAAMDEAARLAQPQEACGILLGEGTRVDGFVHTRNVHPTPNTHFEIDPQALIDAHRNARGGGAQVLGYFHSHPVGVAKPSATDRAMAARDGAIWAIWAIWANGRQGDDAGAPKSATICFYRAVEAGFTELSFVPIPR